MNPARSSWEHRSGRGHRPLRDFSTLVATLVIPVTVLVTLGAMKALGMSFNLMTLGGASPR